MRSEIERHVTEVLAQQGHVPLCTSRPAGVDEGRFAAFHKLSLSPLSELQQQQAPTQRLGLDRAATLLQYVRDHVLSDDEGKRVTANLLMLSMVASVFELRQGIDMLRTVNTRDGLKGDAQPRRRCGGALRELLQRIFFEAQVAERHHRGPTA